MTNLQVEFYKRITSQMKDFNSITDKDLIIEHLEKIPDNKLNEVYKKMLSDKKTKWNGYITMITFISICEVEVQKYIGAELASLQPKINALYDKREYLFSTLINKMSAQEKYTFIEKLENKKTMLGTEDNPYFTEIEIFTIEKQFGYKSFFNESNNYQIKEEIIKGFKYYLMQNYMIEDNGIKKLQ